MRRIAVLIASAAINAATIPAVASECSSSNDIDASRARWATLRSQPANATDNVRCRAYAASFYESVTLRQAAARRVGGIWPRLIPRSRLSMTCWRRNVAIDPYYAPANGNPRVAQVILFPLMTAWMWFQIFTASPLLSSGHPVEDTSDADISLLSVPLEGG